MAASLMRVLRLVLLVSGIVMLVPLLRARSSTVLADSGTCTTHNIANSYYYSDNSYVAYSYAENYGGPWDIDEASCNADSQDLAIMSCGVSCEQASPGTAYCLVDWWDWFDGSCQDSCSGPVHEQYGC